MKVSWDDYSQYMEKYKMSQTTNQILLQISKFESQALDNANQQL